MGLQQQSTTTMGIEHTPANARNAALTGTTQVLNQYSQEVLQAIKKDGIYVMVPPGKEFYVLVESPIDRAKARIADEPIPVAETQSVRAASGRAASAASR